MASTPVITSAIYTGTQVTVQWNAPSGTVTSYSIQVVPTSGSGPNYSSSNLNPFMTFGSVPVTTPLSGQYMVQVGAVFSGSSTPSWGQGVLLLTTQPVITAAAYNGSEITASWSPIVSQSPQITGWQILVWVPTGGGNQYTSQVYGPSASSGSISLAAPLDTQGGTLLYNITVEALTNAGSKTYSATSAATTINAQLPSISKVVYSGTSLQAFWMGPVAPTVPVTSFRLSILDEDGNEIFGDTQNSGSVSSDILNLPAPLPATGQYSTLVSAITSGNIASVSPPVPFNAMLPEVSSANLLSVSGALNVAAQWIPISYPAVPVTSYNLLVQSPSLGSGYSTSISNAYASSGQVNVNAGWNATLVYYVQVAAVSGIVETRSVPLDLITGLPVLSSVLFNGTQLQLAWTAPSSSLNPDRYKALVTDNNGTTWYETLFEGPAAVSGTIELLAPLNMHAQYSIVLEAMSGGIVAASSAAVPVQQFAPLIYKAQYDGANVTVFWDLNPLSGSSVGSLTVTVSNPNNTTQYSQTGIAPATQTYQLPVPAGSPFTTLDPTLGWEVSVTAVSSNPASAGALPALLLVTELPQLNQISYDSAAQTLSFEWTAAPGNTPQVAGYMLLLYSTGNGQTYSQYLNNPQAGNGTISFATTGLPDSTATWLAVVQARSMGGIVSGSSNTLTLNMGTTAITSAVYNAGLLELTATAVAGATSYRFSIYENDNNTEWLDVSLPSLSIPVQLDPAKTYTVKVSYANGSSWGSESAAFALQVLAPLISSASYDGTTLTVSWQAPSGSGFSYAAQLLQNGAPVSGITFTYSGTTATATCALSPATDYSVVVNAGTGNATGPYSIPVPVLAMMPVPVKLVYDGTNATLFWDPVNSLQVTGYTVNLTALASAPVPDKTMAVGDPPSIYTTRNNFLTLPLANSPGSEYSLSVQAVNDASLSTGPFSANINVLTEAPALSAASYDGHYLTVSWPATTNSTVVTVLENGAAVLSGSSSGSSLTLPASLSPEAGYSVVLQAFNGISYGPASTPVALISLPPVLTSLQCSGSSLAFTWSPVSGISSATAVLLENGVPVSGATFTYDLSASSGTASFAFSPATDYTLLLTVTNGAVTSPPSLAVPVISAAPVVIASSFDGTSVSLGWTSSANPATGYLVTLFEDSTAQPVTQANYSRNSAIVLPLSTTTGKTYTARVQAVLNGTLSQGPSSAAASIVTQIPSPGSSVYDGRYLTLNWTALAGLGIEVSLFENGNLQTTESSASGASSLVLPVSLSADAAYSVQLRAFAPAGSGSPAPGTASGPYSSSTALLSEAPVISSTSYDGTTLQLSWSEISGASYTVSLLLNDEPVGGVSFTYTGATASAAVTLAAASNYSVVVTATLAGATGPASAAVPVIAAAPQAGTSSFDGTNITFNWETVEAAGITGYLVTLKTTPQSGTSTSTQYYTRSNSLTTAYTVTAGSSSVISVQAIFDQPQLVSGAPVAKGPASASLAIQTASPVLTSVSYDGAFITAAWTAMSGYTISVIISENGATVCTASSTGNSVVFPARLSPQGVYQLQLQATLSGATGPLSTATALLTAAPAVSKTTYDASAGSTQVTWNAAGGISYSLQLMENGTASGAPVSSSTSPATITQTLSASVAYSVLVTPSSGSVTGPASAAAVISSAPVPLSAGFDGSNVTLSWQAMSGDGLTGYFVTLYENGTALATTAANYTANNFITLPLAVTSGKTYTAGIQATIDDTAAQGPTATVSIVTVQPVLGSAVYDGAFLTAGWAALAGYEVRATVLENGNVLCTATSNGSSLTIPVSLPETGSGYTLTLEAFAGISTGQPIAPVSLISAPPQVQTMTYTAAGTLTVNWNAVPGAASYQIFLYCEGIAQSFPAPPVYSGTTATASGLSLNQAKVYSITVQAVSGSVTGPPCEAEPFITAAPVLTDWHYNGQELTVEWGAIAQETVTGYEVQISGGSIPAQFTPTNSISFSPGFTAGTSYTMTVCAVGNKATGPSASAVNPYEVDPAFYYSTPATGIPPYLFTANALPPTPAGFVLYLPELFNTPPDPLPSSLTNPTVPAAPAVSSFVLSANSGNASLPYKLTVATNSDAFTFSASLAPIRSTLQADFMNFITNLEAVAGGLLPGVVGMIRQLVARSYPLTYSETLYYACGFNPGTGSQYVNLQAGMRLTLSFQEYQFTGSSSPSTQSQNGYVGSGSSSYVLGSYLTGSPGSQLLDTGFSNFLSQIIQQVDSNGNTGGGGVLDYYTANMRQPWMRIVYPSKFPAANTAGTASLTSNIALLVAPSATQLETATTQFINSGTVPSGVYSAFLRGRVLLVPEIMVSMNGKYLWVAVGTTLRQLMDQFGGLPIRPQSGTTTWKESGLTLLRSTENVITNASTVTTYYSIGSMMPVNLGYAAITGYPDGTDNFDLPLLQGDAVYF